MTTIDITGSRLTDEHIAARPLALADLPEYQQRVEMLASLSITQMGFTCIKSTSNCR